MSPLTICPAVSDADWQHVRGIRQRVFVDEQACPPEEEWDAHDVAEARGHTVHHLLGTVDGVPAAAARWRSLDSETAKLERFAVLPAYRGRGYGRQMIEHAMEAAQASGHTRLVLHAQTYLVELYRQLGFERGGEPFDEAGIEHVKMTWGGGSDA